MKVQDLPLKHRRKTKAQRSESERCRLSIGAHQANQLADAFPELTLTQALAVVLNSVEIPGSAK